MDAVALEAERLHAAGDAVNASIDWNDRALISKRGELRDAGRAELLGSVRWRPSRSRRADPLGQSQRLQHGRIEQAEDERVGADAERERESRGQRESWSAAQRPRAREQVARASLTSRNPRRCGLLPWNARPIRTRCVPCAVRPQRLIPRAMRSRARVSMWNRISSESSSST